MIRILLCDDHAIVRAGLRVLLEGEPDVAVVGEASDGHEAVEKAQQLLPDIVLLDLSMPGGNGSEAITRLRSTVPRTRVLVLSMHGAPEFVRPALRAGASGYIVKGSGLTDLLSALRTVSTGGRFLGPEAEKVMALDSLHPDAGRDRDGRDKDRDRDELMRLTPREREVLQLVAEGRTNRQIAERLKLSPKTVDTHRSSMMRKLDLHDAQAVTRFAVRRGLILPD
ncbi:MAG: response regulator transcription factor [Polyangia bacterium]